MRIRWENVFAVALIALILFLLARAGREVRSLVTETFSTTSWAPEHGEVVGLMVFGLIILLIVAVVRILVSRGK